MTQSPSLVKGDSPNPRENRAHMPSLHGLIQTTGNFEATCTFYTQWPWRGTGVTTKVVILWKPTRQQGIFKNLLLG